MNLLEKVYQLEKEAADFGFEWENPQQIMEQIHSECEEIQEHLQSEKANPNALQEEIGDLLHAVFSLCVFCKFSPEATLDTSLSKFDQRLAAVKLITQERGLNDLKQLPFAQLMEIWQEAKQRII